MKNNSAGFTLIELLVAISIMLLMLGMSIASYIRFNDKQRVTTLANEIRTLAEVARAKARAQEVPTSGNCSPGHASGLLLSDYRLQEYESGKKVRLVMRCDLSGKSASDPSYSQHDIFSNYIIDVDARGAVVSFELPGQILAFLPLTGGPRSSEDIKVLVTGSEFKSSFIVKSTGDITAVCVEKVSENDCP